MILSSFAIGVLFVLGLAVIPFLIGLPITLAFFKEEDYKDINYQIGTVKADNKLGITWLNGFAIISVFILFCLVGNLMSLIL
jgi:hypothetical protein